MIMGMYDERGLYIIFGTMAAVAIIGAIMIIAVYILIGLLLSKLNKLIYGKNTVMAWIPPFNVYLLGKLTVGKWLGWFLVLCYFFDSELKITINGITKTITVFPEILANIVEKVYFIGIIILFICAIIKYDRLKNNKRNDGIVSSNQPGQTSNSELNSAIKNFEQNMMMNDKVPEEKIEKEIVSNVPVDSSNIVIPEMNPINNNVIVEQEASINENVEESAIQTTVTEQKAEHVISDNIQNDKIDSL